MTMYEIWTFETGLGASVKPRDLVGYKVEALDGSIGKIDSATEDAGSSRVVVDTGPWIFGKKVLLPAGVVERIDANEEKLYVTLTKDQIKDSPEFNESTYRDQAYRDSVADHYTPLTRR